MIKIRQNILACMLLLAAIAGFGLLSFSRQWMLNDVYATSYAYTSTTSTDWDVAEDQTWTGLTNNSNTMFASTDSIAKPVPAPLENNNQQEKKSQGEDNDKNNVPVTFLYEAFNWLYNSGFLRLPPQ